MDSNDNDIGIKMESSSNQYDTSVIESKIDQNTLIKKEERDLNQTNSSSNTTVSNHEHENDGNQSHRSLDNETVTMPSNHSTKVNSNNNTNSNKGSPVNTGNTAVLSIDPSYLDDLPPDKIKYRRKPVIMYSYPQGDLICEFKSIAEASKQTRISMNTILENCMKKVAHVKDYVFKLTDDETIYMDSKSVQIIKSYERELTSLGYILNKADIDSTKHPVAIELVGKKCRQFFKGVPYTAEVVAFLPPDKIIGKHMNIQYTIDT